MKNKILAILILTMLSLPCSVQAVYDIEPVETVQEEVVEQQQPENEVQNITEPEQLTSDNLTYKQPVSKKKVAKKFLLAMFGVVASSLIIFLGLSLYNRIRESFYNSVKTPSGEVSLETPEDLSSAVRAFLDKTNWKG